MLLNAENSIENLKKSLHNIDCKLDDENVIFLFNIVLKLYSLEIIVL